MSAPRSREVGARPRACTPHPGSRSWLVTRRQLIVAGAFLLVAAAASDDRSGRLAAEPAIAVEGRVMLDGRPLDGAVVTLVPAEVLGGRCAYGWTGPDGTFRLKTPFRGEEVLPGQYRVLITPRRSVLRQELERPTRAAAIPRRYGNLDETPLTFSVPPGGKLLLDLASRDDG